MRVTLHPGVGGITNVLAHFSSRNRAHIAYYLGDGYVFGTPFFSDLDPEDRQFLLNLLWKQIPQRSVILCPKPTRRESWTENDSMTSQTAALLSSRSKGSATFA